MSGSRDVSVVARRGPPHRRPAGAPWGRVALAWFTGIAGCAGPIEPAPTPIDVPPTPVAERPSGEPAGAASALANAPDIRLDPRDLDAWFAHVLPPNDPHDTWLPSAASGLRAARASGKPLLLWVEGTHPLSCDCPGELMGSRTVFHEASLAPLLAEFVLAAESRHPMEAGDDDVARTIRLACARGDGPMARTVGSGVYALTVTGASLGRAIDLREATMHALLAGALERWYEALDADPEALSPNPSTPAATQVLTAIGRPLPLSDDPREPRHPDLSRDEVWLATSDALVPGARDADGFARHLATTVLVDPQAPRSFSGSAVRLATLRSADGEAWSGATFAEAADGRAVAARIVARVRAGDPESLRVVAKGYVRRSAGASWTPAGWALRPSPPHRRGFVPPRTGD